MTDPSLPPSTANSIINNPMLLRSVDPSNLENSATQAQQILAGYTHGFQTLFILNATLTAIAFVVAIFMINKENFTRNDDDALKEEASGWSENSTK